MGFIGLKIKKWPKFHLTTDQGGHKPGKPGILRDLSEHGKLMKFSGNSVQPQGQLTALGLFPYLSGILK